MVHQKPVNKTKIMKPSSICLTVDNRNKRGRSLQCRIAPCRTPISPPTRCSTHRGSNQAMGGLLLSQKVCIVWNLHVKLGFPPNSYSSEIFVKIKSLYAMVLICTNFGLLFCVQTSCQYVEIYICTKFKLVLFYSSRVIVMLCNSLQWYFKCQKLFIEDIFAI